MERSVEPREFELPLELQFAMRKAELQSEEMTWEELRFALLSLYHQRLMEWHAIKDIMASENIEIDWDHPTDLELAELAAACRRLGNIRPIGAAKPRAAHAGILHFTRRSRAAKSTSYPCRADAFTSTATCLP